MKELMKPSTREIIAALKFLGVYLLICCFFILIQGGHQRMLFPSPSASLLASKTIPGSIKKTPKVGFFKRLKYIKQGFKKDLKDVIKQKRRESKGIRIFLVLALCGLVALILLVLSFVIGYGTGSESLMNIFLLLSLVGVLLLAFFLIRGVIRGPKAVNT